MKQIEVFVNVLRHNVKITELYPRNAPSITTDSTSAICSSFTGEFIPNDIVDWFQDELQPIIVIDGVENPCGIFIPTTVTRSDNYGIPSVSVEAYDRGYLAESTVIESLVYFPQGTNYITAIKQLLQQSGIMLVAAVPTTYTLQTDREDWTAGTSYLTIINQLLDEINYKPLFFDARGYAKLEPESIVSVDRITRVYDADSNDIKVFDGFTSQIDFYDIPNVVVCTCNNSELSYPLVAKVENDNPASPFSISRRGKRICKYIELDNVANQQAIEDYARLVLQDNMLIGETATVRTTLIPNCGINDIVAVVNGRESGMYREIGWNMILEACGIMEHSLERMAAVL